MFIVRISHIANPRKKLVCVARHLSGTDAGSVQLVRQFTTDVVINFPSTGELNKFMKIGSTEWKVDKVDRPKVYFTDQVATICTPDGCWCQAHVWPEGDSESKTVFKGPKRDSATEAQKMFWYVWNHGDHAYKTDEGNSARLVRYKAGYYMVEMPE
jgi:hypothetical protein